MQSDLVVKEVRRVREAHAREHGFDLHEICADLKNKQALLGDRLVSRQSRLRGLKKTS